MNEKVMNCERKCCESGISDLVNAIAGGVD